MKKWVLEITWHPNNHVTDKFDTYLTVAKVLTVKSLKVTYNNRAGAAQNHTLVKILARGVLL